MWRYRGNVVKSTWYHSSCINNFFFQTSPGSLTYANMNLLSWAKFINKNAPLIMHNIKSEGEVGF